MDRFKPIKEEDLEYIDKRFTAYLFYNRLDGGRYYECSRCRQSGIIPKIRRTDCEADRALENAIHNNIVRCPFCGAVCTMKNSGIAKGRKSLWEERKFVIVETTEAGEVLLRALKAYRGYGNFNAMPGIDETKRWVLTPGKVEIWECGFYGRWNKLKRSLKDAFQDSPYSYYYQKEPTTYEFIHLGRLKNVEFMRYCSIHEYIALVGSVNYVKTEDKAVRYLCEYAKYPRLEMLVKCGLESIVDELVRFGRKHKGIIDWNAKTPWAALHLTKPEYKILLDMEDKYRYQTVECLHYWRKGNRKARIEGAITLMTNEIWNFHKVHLEKYVFPLDITAEKIAKSIRRSGSQFWTDYIDAAEKLGYDLKNPVVVFPKDLKRAHDLAISQVKYETNQKLEAAGRESVERRKKRYNFVSGDYLIRVAETMQEIIAEGKVLLHCVGGYAERHMKEQTTILFVRRADDPDIPLCTVEYRNGAIIQAYCRKNTDPPQEIKDFLELWKDYIYKKPKKEEAGAEALAPAA